MRSKIGAGVVGGLIAGVVFGMMMQSEYTNADFAWHAAIRIRHDAANAYGGGRQPDGAFDIWSYPGRSFRLAVSA